LFVEKAREVHNNMTILLVSVCKKLNVEADHILDVIDQRPGPEVPAGMEEKIQTLEK